MHLQIHHIHELEDGGTDDRDNLIPICVTCHVDVHTQTKLTRRFSRGELKKLRDSVIALVKAGKLPAGPDVEFDIAEFVGTTRRPSMGGDSEPRLDALAAAALVAAATGNGRIIMIEGISTSTVRAGKSVLQDGKDERALAKCLHAVESLEACDFVRATGTGSAKIWTVTHPGYLYADVLISAGAGSVAGSSSPTVHAPDTEHWDGILPRGLALQILRLFAQEDTQELVTSHVFKFVDDRRLLVDQAIEELEELGLVTRQHNWNGGKYERVVLTKAGRRAASKTLGGTLA